MVNPGSGIILWRLNHYMARAGLGDSWSDSARKFAAADATERELLPITALDRDSYEDSEMRLSTAYSGYTGNLRQSVVVPTRIGWYRLWDNSYFQDSFELDGVTHVP